MSLREFTVLAFASYGLTCALTGCSWFTPDKVHDATNVAVTACEAYYSDGPGKELAVQLAERQGVPLEDVATKLCGVVDAISPYLVCQEK